MACANAGFCTHKFLILFPAPLSKRRSWFRCSLHTIFSMDCSYFCLFFTWSGLTSYWRLLTILWMRVKWKATSGPVVLISAKILINQSRIYKCINTICCCFCFYMRPISKCKIFVNDMFVLVNCVRVVLEWLYS